MASDADDFDRKWSEAQDGGMGEHPPLDSSSFSDNFYRSELGSDWSSGPGRLIELPPEFFPTVLGAPSPNGMATVLLSCRCGMTVATELKSVDGDLGGTMLDYDLPEGWLVEIVRDRDTLVRCPAHRQIV